MLSDKLFQKNDETFTAFTVRRMRAEFLEEAAKLVEAETVTPDDNDPDSTDISYNMALTHAAEAIRRAAVS